jgi:polyphosphate kinase
MDRNLDRRVEVLAPVNAPELQARLDEIFAVLEADDALAWELESTGRWHRVSANGDQRTVELEHDALERARRIAAV